jgi:hypothetical protein
MLAPISDFVESKEKCHASQSCFGATHIKQIWGYQEFTSFCHHPHFERVMMMTLVELQLHLKNW